MQTAGAMCPPFGGARISKLTSQRISRVIALMATLQELFAQPTNSYRMQPFWFLNHDLREDELRWQIQQMHQQGIGGAVLHPRHGLVTEYMSKKWLDAIDVCIDEMRKYGMEAWLYDELNWPSGTHGGEVTRDHPEFRMRYLRVQSLHVSGGVTYQVRLPAYGGTLLSVQAIRITPDSADGGDLKFVGEPRELFDCWEDDRFRWQAPPGDWFLVAFFEFETPAGVTWKNGYYLDTMNGEAVRDFRNHAYEPYTRFEDEFGKTVKGMFTDEPGLMIHDAFGHTNALAGTADEPKRTLPGVTLAWTRDMFNRFEKFADYELRPKLMHLLYELGPETQKVRSDYHGAVSEWYIHNYHGQLGDWCRDRGIDYIGHTLEDPLWGQVRTQGDQLAVLAKLDRPGFDYLGDDIGPRRLLSAKCATSAAHIGGKQRVMCEAIGGSGHHVTLERMRANLNFMCVLGCNMLIPHAFYYSFEGLRKADWPPTEFYHNGYWPWFRQFADYSARLCLMQASGDAVVDTLVLLPAETMAVDAWEQGKPVHQPQCERLLAFLSDELLSIHRDYDLVNDDQLSNAVVDDQRLAFVTSKCEYPLLIIPGARVMSVAAARKIAAFYEAGGNVIFLGNLPSQTLVRGQDSELQNIIRGILGAVEGADIFSGEAGAEMAVANEAGGNAVWSSDAEITSEWLCATINELIAADIVIQGEDAAQDRGIFHCHRRDGDNEIYMFFNRAAERQEATVTIPILGQLSEWDLETGDTQLADADYTVPVRRIATIASDTGVIADATGEATDDSAELVTGAQTAWYMELDPDETRIFVLDTAARGESISIEGTVEPEIIEEIPLGDTWRFEAREDNVAILDRWQFIAHDRVAGDRLHVNDTPGRVNTYVTTFEVDGRIGNVRLVLDDLHQYIPAHAGTLAQRRNLEIYINGKPAPSLQNANWQDHYFEATDISALIQQGKNEIQICTVCLLDVPFDSLDYPAYLVGDFAEISGQLRPQPTQVNQYFSELGYPHYSGIGAHTLSFDLSEETMQGNRRMVLDVGRPRDVARFLVNGEEVAIRMWDPYEIDVTNHLKAGRNEICVEVTGTLANLYSKAETPAGLPGEARIWVIG